MSGPRRSFLAGAVVTALGPLRRSRRTTTTVPRPAAFVRHGPATRPAVALTFHGSGDPGLFQELLAAARRTAVPITVFAVGAWLDANPSFASTIQQAGHELANHTYTHPALGELGRTAVADEIVQGRAAIARHADRRAGAVDAWFRPSGIEVPSSSILEEAARAGYRTVVGYDVDPSDFQDPGADAVVGRVLGAVHPGAIVSLHTGHAGTVEAFEPLAAELRRRNLRPVLLRQLLAP